MAETVITKIVDVQTGKAVTNVRQLKKEISSLKDYLASLDKTSAEYTKTIERLNQYETQLNNVNKISQQNTQKLADQLANLSRIGSGLAGGFGALNGLLALLGKSGDDLSKVLVKLQGGIAVVQGIGGLEGLAKSLPSIKNWFDHLKDGVLDLIENLSPFNRRITESAQALNSLDVQPIKDLAGIGDVSVSASVSGGSKEIVQTTQALQQQQKTIVPVNEQWNKYTTELENAKNAIKEWNTDFDRYLKVLKEHNKYTTEAVVDVESLEKQMREFAATGKGGDALVKTLREITLDENALRKATAALGEDYNEIAGTFQNIQDDVQDDVDILKQLETQLNNTAKSGSKIKGILKSVLGTAGWTILITAIITAAYKLGEYIAKLYKASKAQQEFDKAINKTTADLAGDSLSAFNELLTVYDQFENKEEFLKEYSEQIEKTGLKINDVKDAEDAFIKHTDDYKKAIIARAQIDAYRQKISEETKALLDKQLSVEQSIDEQTANYIASVNTSIGRLGGPVGEEKRESIRKRISEQAYKDLQKDVDRYNKFMEQAFNATEELRKQYKPFWAGGKEKDGDGGKVEVDKELETLNKFLKDSEKLSYTEKEYAIKTLDEQYIEMLALAEKYGVDVTKIDEIFYKKRDELFDKYNKIELEKNKEATKSKYDQFKEELARIRQLSDTSNLRQPQEQAYNTRYGQKFSRVFGAGFDRNEVFTYQSKEDIQKQYAETIKYNNDLYALTKQRIDAENKLLLDQLSNSKLTADQRLEIERTLRENEIALSDAAIKNELDNAKAYDDVQAKKRQALQATLSVASSVAGSLASIAQTESQNDKLSEEQRKKAFTTYKIAATTQAIMDTYAAANSSYQAMASIPYVGPFLGAAAAAAAIASGIANVVQIQRTQFSASSSVNASTVTPPDVTQPNIEYTRNLLGDREIDEVNKPIKVYVTERDITDAQNRVKVVTDNATF